MPYTYFAENTRDASDSGSRVIAAFDRKHALEHWIRRNKPADSVMFYRINSGITVYAPPVQMFLDAVGALTEKAAAEGDQGE